MGKIMLSIIATCICAFCAGVCWATDASPIAVGGCVVCSLYNILMVMMSVNSYNKLKRSSEQCKRKDVACENS